MNLMQTILTEIEQEATEKSRNALANSGLIYEAEILAFKLQSTGLTDVGPCFIPYSTGGAGVIFYDHNKNSRMREALAASGIEIEAEEYGESLSPNTRDAHLTLKGLSCRVWINYDPIPLAEAA